MTFAVAALCLICLLILVLFWGSLVLFFGLKLTLLIAFLLLMFTLGLLWKRNGRRHGD